MTQIFAIEKKNRPILELRIRIQIWTVLLFSDHFLCEFFVRLGQVLALGDDRLEDRLGLGNLHGLLGDLLFGPLGDDLLGGLLDHLLLGDLFSTKNP